MITVEHKGSFRNVENFLKYTTKKNYMLILRMYALKGLEALEAATPKNTGETANSWSYEIVKETNGYAIYWKNNHVSDGVNVALLIQLGHGTKGGAYVQGIDYINPALKSTFDELSNQIWMEVRRA